jgi:hypothetical protein
MTTSPHWVSYYDQTFSISLLAPADWTAARTDDFPFVLLSPPENGYRSNLGFSETHIEPLSAERLDQEIAKLKAQQASDYENFRSLEERKFWLDGHPAWQQRYEWQPRDKPYHFSQVLALLVVNENTLYEINGATLKELETTYMPIFERIIESIRLIPR